MTTPFAYLLIALMVALTSYAQLVLKWQITRQFNLIPPPHDIIFYLRLLLNPWVISSFAAVFVASFCWMAALSKLPISKAYPASSMTFVVVVIGSVYLFSEAVTWPKMVGLAFIILGVGIVSQG